MLAKNEKVKMGDGKYAINNLSWNKKSFWLFEGRLVLFDMYYSATASSTD